MHDLPPFPAAQSSDPQRTRFFTLLSHDRRTPILTEPKGLDDGLLYLHFLSLPALHWEDYTLEFASLQQLAEALCAPETIDFLCARIKEVWHWQQQLLSLLRSISYTEYIEDMIGPEPLVDQELTASLMKFSWQHPLFTPELVHLFLRLLADETARHRLGDVLHAHAQRELHRIVQARFLKSLLFRHGNSQAALVQTIARFAQKGLLVQEAEPPLVRLRFLPSLPVAQQQETAKPR
jgi:hypothetical protein